MYGQKSCGLKIGGQMVFGQNDIGRNVIGRNVFGRIVLHPGPGPLPPSLCTPIHEHHSIMTV